LKDPGPERAGSAREAPGERFAVDRETAMGQQAELDVLRNPWFQGPERVTVEPTRRKAGGSLVECRGHFEPCAIRGVLAQDNPRDRDRSQRRVLQVG